MTTQVDKKETIKIKEFEWYEVETKVREIMGELLQPFNKKQTEQSIKINEIKRNIATMTKKLEDHDFLLERENAQKPPYLQLQDDKIAETLRFVSDAQLQNEGKLQRMAAVIAVYQEKITQLNELEKRLDQQIFQRSEDFKRYKEGLDKEVELLGKKQDAQLQEATQFKNITKSAVSKMETRMVAFDNRLKELEDENRHKGSDIRKLLEEASIHNEKITKLEMKAVNLNSRIEDRQRDSKLSQKFFSKVKQVETDLKFISTFLEQYQPLYTQMMIADTLNSFVQGRQRRQLCNFQEQKFAKLHHHILMNQKITLQEMMGTFTNNIRKIINRNKKYVINLAVAESVKYGGNVYEFRIQEPKQVEESENKKPANYVVPEEDIARIVESKWATLSGQMHRVMEDEILPTKTWMKELQEQTLLRSLEYDRKYQELRKKTFENEARQDLEEKATSQSLAQIHSRTSQIDAQVSYFKEYIRDVLNFSSVINHIVIQDEIDRQGTALYALRANKNSSETIATPTLQLDPNCMNCENKNSAPIQQAFKMACLTYNPSQIRIDEQLFSREEILQISTSILEKLKKKLWTGETVKPITSEREVFRRTNNISTTLVAGTGENKKRSASTMKEANMTARDGFRGRQAREMQTLLPVLGAMSKPQRRDRKPQLSVFY